MSKSVIIHDTGGVTFPKGFRAAGVCCGLRKKRLDLALIVSDEPAVAGGVFTKNICCAAPVEISRAHVHSDTIRALLINAGNANAATGEEGYDKAVKCVEEVAFRLDCTPSEVLVASTGIIGVPLPEEKIISSLDELANALSEEGGCDAADAILTTDTCRKICSCTIEIDGVPVRLGGMAKGSGMIMPDMATMLACITTDATLTREAAQRMLSAACNSTFNRITVDGDTSTNDSVFLLANGASGAEINSNNAALFEGALRAMCMSLAHAIVRDGEGATKFVAVTVTGCTSVEDAEKIARTVANSPLVKTALYGEDPNWGRVLAAAGRAGVLFDPYDVSISFNDRVVAENGCATGVARADARAALKTKDITLKIICGEGDCSATVWTSDLTHGYIDINVDYS